MDKPKYIIYRRHNEGAEYMQIVVDALDDIGAQDGDTVFEISRAWKVTQPKIKFEKLEE